MYSVQNAGGLAPEALMEFQYLSAKLRAWVAVDHNEDGTHNVPAATSTRMVGEIIMWPSSTIPEKWLLLNGAQKSRTTYQALFEVCGTRYGAGDGSTTFHLPNFTARVPMGRTTGGSGNALGDVGDIFNTNEVSGVATFLVVNFLIFAGV